MPACAKSHTLMHLFYKSNRTHNKVMLFYRLSTVLSPLTDCDNLCQLHKLEGITYILTIGVTKHNASLLDITKILIQKKKFANRLKIRRNVTFLPVYKKLIHK